MNIDLKDLERISQEMAELKKIYPDLREQNLRFKTVLVSKEVNKNPDDCYTAHSCGCCQDAALYAYFFKNHGETKVYSDPPYVCIGNKNPYYDSDCNDQKSEEIDFDWESNVTKNIGPKAAELLRKQIEVYL